MLAYDGVHVSPPAFARPITSAATCLCACRQERREILFGNGTLTWPTTSPPVALTTARGVLLRGSDQRRSRQFMKNHFSLPARIGNAAPCGAIGKGRLCHMSSARTFGRHCSRQGSKAVKTGTRDQEPRRCFSGGDVGHSRAYRGIVGTSRIALHALYRHKTIWRVMFGT